MHCQSELEPEPVSYHLIVQSSCSAIQCIANQNSYLNLTPFTSSSDYLTLQLNASLMISQDKLNRPPKGKTNWPPKGKLTGLPRAKRIGLQRAKRTSLQRAKRTELPRHSFNGECISIKCK